MATTKLYLDTRKSKGDKKKPVSLKIAVNHRSGTGYIVLNIKLLPDQWDAKNEKVKDHPQKDVLNHVIKTKHGAISALLLELCAKGEIDNVSATELCRKLKEALGEGEEKSKPSKPKEDKTTVKYWYDRWLEHKTGGTKALYEVTRKRLVKYTGSEEAFGKLHFEDITKDWLVGLVNQMSETAKSANTRGICLRNLRTVCNYAIDNDVTTYYPFRRFKIESAKTRKRNFDIDTLRKLLNHTCEEEWQQKYLDYFRLTFMLIGINSADLFGLEKISQGRVEYIRAKTHKPYSIKVEPEAREIIERYKGTKRLLGFCENYVRHKHFFNNLSKGLNQIKDQVGIDELTTYWARHSWATIARKIGISKDTIGLALGHSQKTVTDIYIDYDPEEIDIANRKVLDYVLYGVGEKKKRGRPKKEATKE